MFSGNYSRSDQSDQLSPVIISVIVFNRAKISQYLFCDTSPVLQKIAWICVMFLLFQMEFCRRLQKRWRLDLITTVDFTEDKIKITLSEYSKQKNQYIWTRSDKGHFKLRAIHTNVDQWKETRNRCRISNGVSFLNILMFLNKLDEWVIQWVHARS